MILCTLLSYTVALTPFFTRHINSMVEERRLEQRGCCCGAVVRVDGGANNQPQAHQKKTEGKNPLVLTKEEEKGPER